MTVLNPWPPYHLLRQTVLSGRAAVAEIPRTLTGNAALYEGHTAGLDVVDGAPNLAPTGAYGKGHDHSGGDMGEPLYQAAASVALGDGETPSGTRFFTTGGGYALLNSAVLAASTNGFFEALTVPRFALFVPPCQTTGVYHALRPRISGHLTASIGTLASGDELEVWVRNTSSPTAQGARVGFVFTGGFGFKTALGDGDMRLVPGQVNLIVFDALQFRTASGGSGRSARLGLYDFSVGIHA